MPPLFEAGDMDDPDEEGFPLPFDEGVVGHVQNSSLKSAAARYQYTNWNDLKDVDVKGGQLRCPRVRLAPPASHAAHIPPPEEVFAADPKLGRRRQVAEYISHKLKLEGWDEAEDVNLSFQELGDAYQLRNFMRILRRMLRVKRLHLVDDMLTDLSSVRLPNCEELHLRKNALSSFKCLPNAPHATLIDLSFNNISSLDGLRSLKALRVLTLTGNPVEFDCNYRYRVFKEVPWLDVLDGIPRTLDDLAVPPDEEADTSGPSCVIC
eukprot:Opistho-2@21779